MPRSSRKTPRDEQPFETLPGWPDLEIVKSETPEDEATGQPPSSLNDLRSSPTRMSVRVRWKGTKGTKQIKGVADLPRGNRPVRLDITHPAWRDNTGEWHPLLQPPKARPGQRPRISLHTKRLRERVFDQWCRGEAVDALERRTGVSRTRLDEWISEDLRVAEAKWRKPDILERLHYLGIDEIIWSYVPLAVLVDLETGTLIDLLPSRDQAVIEEALRQIAEFKRQHGQPDWRPVIATDLWVPYRDAVQRVFGDRALHVADRFHIVEKVQNDLQEMAWQLTKTPDFLDKEPHYALRQQLRSLVWRLYQQRRQQLKGGTSAELQPTQEREALGAAGFNATGVHHATALIDLALSFHRIWACETAVQGWSVWREWRAQAHQWGRDVNVTLPFNSVVNLLDTNQWAVEMMNGLLPEARLPNGKLLSTGKVEATNRRLRKLMRWMQQRKNVYSTDSSSWDEEEQFQKLRLRALYASNVASRPPERLECFLPPDVSPCLCSAPAERLTVRPDGQEVRLHDLPLWGAHVTARSTPLRVECRDCGQVRHLVPPAHRGLTTRLHAFLQERFWQDGSLRAIAHETGLGVGTLREYRRLLPDPQPPTKIPPYLGFIPFRWRKQECVLITNVETGLPIDLLPQASTTAILEWLDPHLPDLRGLFLDRVNWLEEIVEERQKRLSDENEVERWRALPGAAALDRFTVATLLRSPLIKAIEAYRRAEGSSRLRTPRYQRHRDILRSSPLDPAPNVNKRLAAPTRQEQLRHHLQDPALAVSYSLVHYAIHLWQLRGDGGLMLTEAEIRDAGLIWYPFYRRLFEHFFPSPTPVEDEFPPLKDLWLTMSDERRTVQQAMPDVYFISPDWMDFDEWSTATLSALSVTEPLDFHTSRRVEKAFQDINDVVLHVLGSSRRLGRAAQNGELHARAGRSLAASRATLHVLRGLSVFGGNDWDRLRLVAQHLTRVGRST